MIFTHNVAIFIHAFNHEHGSIRRDLQELPAERVFTEFPSNGRDGQSRSLHRYRLRDFTDKVGLWSDGIVGTMESDSILVFVRTVQAVDAFHEGVMPDLGLQCVILLKR
jgi:hypothetical protein